MEIEINYAPSNTAAKLSLNSGEECTTEAGAMISMNSNLNIETTTHKKGKGNILKSLKRLFAGESFFLNHYTAPTPGELWISSKLPGDMIVHELNNEKLIVQSGSFMACESTVEMDVGWQGFKSLFSGESLFWLSMTGVGKVLLNAFGSIYEVDVDGEYVVDTGHIVAFEETLQFSISKAGSSWLNSFMGGEGLTCRFKGRGKIYCQSHNPREFGLSLRPHLKQKRG